MIKTFLKAKYTEDGKFSWIIIVAIIIILAFLVRSEKTIGLALLIAGIYFGAWFVSSFNIRCGIEIILSGCGYYRKAKAWLHIIGALAYNLPLGLAVLVYISLQNGKMSFLCLFYAAVVYLFANAVGVLVGTFVKKSISGLFICSLISLVNFPKVLVLEQELRFISPVIQLGNLKVFQWWNLLSLAVIAIAVYAWILLRKRRVIWLLFGCMAAIIFADITIAKTKNKVCSDYEIYARDVLEYVNECNAKCGFDTYESIVVYKSVYYPWMSNEKKVPIYVRDNTIYMNCFTESLCDMDEREIMIRAVNSLLKPDLGAQNVMASFYRQWLMDEEENIYKYLENVQIEQTGRVYNPFYGLVAEVLIYQPEKYGELYLLSGTCDTKEEVMEKWEEIYD